MNYTFDKSKLSTTQLFTIEKMKEKIRLNPKMRKTNLYNLIVFWVKEKSLNLNNESEFNFLLYYFFELGFDYDEIIDSYMDFNNNEG